MVIELCKNSITLDTAVYKNVPLLYFLITPWNIDQF